MMRISANLKVIKFVYDLLVLFLDELLEIAVLLSKRSKDLSSLLFNALSQLCKVSLDAIEIARELADQSFSLLSNGSSDDFFKVGGGISEKGFDNLTLRPLDDSILNFHD